MQTLSVIMPTYKENVQFLRLSVESILNQTFRDFEFLIVIEPDEINLDFLENVGKQDSRVQILRNDTRLGISGSRNRAIMKSAGKYIALIDGDDYCDLIRFETQVNFLEEHPQISVVGSNMNLVDENNNITGVRKYPELFEEIKKGFMLTMAVANPTIMLRKEALGDIGLFDPQFSKAEDFELWMRFLAKGKKMHNIQKNLVYYRIPASNAEKRPRIHWKNNYISRKRYSKYIWPLHQRVVSLLLFFVISSIPAMFIDNLLTLGFVYKIRNIKTN